MKNLIRGFGILAFAALVCGCTRHEVEVKPIRVEPIRIEMDVNIKMQRELQDMFAFEKKLQKAEAEQPSEKNDN